MPDHDPAAGARLGPGDQGRIAEALVATSHDALMAIDGSWTILAWNWGAQNLYGYSDDEACGRNALDLLVPPAHQEEARTALRECLATGSAILDAVRRRRDGVEVHVQALFRWFPGAAGQAGFTAVGDSDVTEARRLERELSQQVWSLTGVQEFLKSVLDASTDYSIVALDLERRVVAWNAGARYDFGYDFEVAKDRPILPLVAGPEPVDQKSLLAALESCLATGRAEAELRMSRQDRRTFPARATITLRKDAFGSPVGFVLIVKDVSEERRAEEERRLALERLLEIRRLGEVDKVKTAVLNTTSHELATPLTPIRLSLRILKSMREEQLGEAGRKAVVAIDRNFERLYQVVQGMVDVVRLQGVVQLEKRPFDLAALARGLVAANQEAATASGLRLSCVAPPSLTVNADAERLRQVGQHFVANALRFTPPGGEVVVRVAADAPSVVLAVQDTGRGLSAEQIVRLFQPFSQVHDTSQETKGGIGVGLYVCKAIVEAHGGNVLATSDGPGKGSTFRAQVPRD